MVGKRLVNLGVGTCAVLMALAAVLIGPQAALAAECEMPRSMNRAIDKLFREFQQALKVTPLDRTYFHCGEYFDVGHLMEEHQELRELIGGAQTYHVFEWEEILSVVLPASDKHEELRLDFYVHEDHLELIRVECITLPIDDVHTLPYEEFRSSPWEAWAREEIRLSQMVHFYQEFCQHRSKPEARQMFYDGAGFVLAADSWVPFYSQRRNFIAYAGWLYKHVYGYDVLIETFSDAEATLVFPNDLFFLIYDRAGHLKRQISRENYTKLYESIWQDRAMHAGWEVRFEYTGYHTVLRFLAVD